MSFTNTIDASNSTYSGTNINGSDSKFFTTSSLTDTSLNYGGVDIIGDGSITSFLNYNIIFGGGGTSPNYGGTTSYDGTNAVQIETNVEIITFQNLGSLCGGGGAGLRTTAYGGAGGGGGGTTVINDGAASGGGIGGNGLHVEGAIGYGGGGGGGGFGANGAVYFPQQSEPAPFGIGSLAGGGGGCGGDAGPYGASVAAYLGGGGAGGGNAEQSIDINTGFGNNGAGGGGGGGIGSSYVTSIGGNGGYGIYNSGTINTLENQQGIGFGLGALFYAGNLPDTYNIVIQSDASFGQLFYTGWYPKTSTTSTTLNEFGISSLSTSILAESYDAVLVNITPKNISGTYSGLTWKLNFVPAGSTNCKNNIVTIGGENYDSYDLVFSGPPVTMDSISPSSGSEGITTTIGFTTNGISDISSIVASFGPTTFVSGTNISFDSTTGKGSATFTVPSGSGIVDVTLFINETPSTNTLSFKYLNNIPTSSELDLYFISGKNELQDSNNIFLFNLQKTYPDTIIFDVSVNNVTSIPNCEFNILKSGQTTIVELQLNVIYNNVNYNMYLYPNATSEENSSVLVNTYITYGTLGSPSVSTINFNYNYINGKNPWNFISSSSTSSSDLSNNTITYLSYNSDVSNNYIHCTSINTNSLNTIYENIGTLGMCGASYELNNLVSNPGTPPSQSQIDTLNGAIAWTFYSLYNITNGFTFLN